MEKEKKAAAQAPDTLTDTGQDTVPVLYHNTGRANRK